MLRPQTDGLVRLETRRCATYCRMRATGMDCAESERGSRNGHLDAEQHAAAQEASEMRASMDGKAGNCELIGMIWRGRY